MIPGYIQAILALAIVIILFVVGFMIYNYEYLKAFRSKGITKQKVVIFEGVKDLKTTANDVYPTQDKNSSQYRDLTPSYNQQGGIEMTYNFWMYMDSNFISATVTDPSAETDVGFKTYNPAQNHQKVLFVKGSTNLVDYNNICGTSKKDIQVKCPLVKLENYGKVLTVEFNTLQGADAVIENTPPVCSELTTNWYVANAHKISLKDLNTGSMLGKFNMFTIIIQDTYPTDPYPYRNKVRCRVFINGVLKVDKYVDGKINPGATDFSTLKTNMGNLVVAPSISPGSMTVSEENKLRLANLSYFNYAIPQAEIDYLYSAGYDNKPVQTELNVMPKVYGTSADTTGVKLFGQ